MALLQGTAGRVGGRGAAAPRRRPSTALRARRRNDPLALLLATILGAFLLGLVYLTQTIHVAARTYEIDNLVDEQRRLVQQIQSLEGDVIRWGSEPAIVERSQQAGLDRLGGRLRVPTR